MVFRKRLIFWLVKAYIQKWGKIIAISFLAGCVVFILLIATSSKLLAFIPAVSQQEKIGLIGAYTVETLPDEVVGKISSGLTKVNSDSSVSPAVAELWQIKNSGKTYVYRLKNNIVFSDGEALDSSKITYNFADVESKIIDQLTISYTLKEPYAPFLVTTSRPIFKDGYIGLGEYEVQSVDLNSNFVKNLTIKSKNQKLGTIKYVFYPTEDSLKLGFVMGELDKAMGLTNPEYNNKSFTKFPGVLVEQYPNLKNLVTVFYNNNDKSLSDPKLRAALDKSLPNEFKQGKSNPIPYPVTSVFANDDLNSRNQDIEYAKALIEASNSDSKITITLSTLEKYENTAKEIAESWKLIGIETKIEVVDRLPLEYSAYLGDFVVPRDPDQYILWHSTSPQNITRYKNLRIDKLLEDGRRQTDTNKRIEIYNDFQKYLQDDVPASFLFFPYQYQVTRKGLFN